MTFTPAQIDALIGLLDECRALGATREQLSPLYDLVVARTEAPVFTD